jgi:hypothetical protein
VKKLLAVLFVWGLTLSSAWSCPNCAGGTVKDGKPPYTLIILSSFVLLIYIPFFILFRAAKKYDPKNGDEHI